MPRRLEKRLVRDVRSCGATEKDTQNEQGEQNTVGNALRHGGAPADLRVWREPGRVVCEVADAGQIDDPLAGRQRPAPEAVNGRGLWLANQLCDLTQLRSGEGGTVLRLHMSVAG